MIWVSIIFFFSGLSALVYQLLWMRHLGLIFGNTVYAGTTVLTAFMSGLAIGSHVFGRFSERLRNPLKCFALLEFGIAIYALSIPFLFTSLRLVYRLAYQNVSDNLLFLTPLRFILAFLLLLLPTLFMGGTLPVIGRAFARENQSFGSRLGWLYGVNTLGAVAGVFLSGFYLIPRIGVNYTNIVAAVTDFLAGAGAWLLACGNLPQPNQEPLRARYSFRNMPSQSRYAVLISMLCGFVSLALEVVWFRALILVFGSTTYSFTVMLGVFLFGMSIGSFLIAPFLDRITTHLPLLAAAVGLIGLCTLSSLYYFDKAPDFLLDYLLRYGLSWHSMTQIRFLVSAAHLAMPAIFFGVAFATAMRIVRKDEPSSSGAIGMVYALNTLGAVAGSFAGGFILLPRLGMEHSLLALGLAMTGAGLVSLITQKSNRAGVRITAGALAAIVTLMLLLTPPAWNKSLLASGAFFSPFNFIREGRVTLREGLMNDRMLFYEEALSSTVSVHLGINEEKYFCVDGKTEADQAPRGMMVQRMIGHLPMLFHPDPRAAVNIGLGAGVSFGALSCYPLKRLEVVEIESATMDGARLWRDLNHNVLEHPLAHVIINDGRNHLFATTNTYDVITSDPFEPVVSGASHLFTVNHFQLARRRLNPGGIMCQWIPMYEMSTDDYLMIARSFVSVFPNTALFFTGFDTLLLGFEGDLHMDPNVVRRNFRIPAVRQSLTEVGFTSPEMILGMFVADLSRNTEFIGQGPLNTDQNPHIEFSVPKKALEYTTDANQTALLHVFTDIPNAWLRDLPQETTARLKAEHEAVRLLLEAAVLRAMGSREQSYEHLMKAHKIAPNSPVVKNELVGVLQTSASALKEMGNRDEAAKQYQIVLKLDPHNFWAIYNLVELGMLAGENVFAKDVLERGLACYPKSPMMLGLKGKILFTEGHRTQGLDLISEALQLHPDNLGLSQDLVKLSALTGNQQLHAYATKNSERIERFIQRE